MVELADFAGAWRLERRIVDRRGAQSGHLNGEARFTAARGGLHYREEGALVLASGARLAARQEHLWHAALPEIVVRFADGRDFHRFDPGAMTPEGLHLCGADLYLVCYDFSDWPRWRVTWTVSGPKKDHMILSAYVGR